MTVTLVGDKELIAKLQAVGGFKYLKPVMNAVGIDYVGKMDDYPQATIANDPGQRRWYERGYGPKYRRRDGTVRGYKTSEDLKHRWAHRVKLLSQNVQVIIGNNASYAEPVHGDPRMGKGQSRAMARIGWPRVDTVLEDRRPKYERMVTKEIEKIINK